MHKDEVSIPEAANLLSVSQTTVLAMIERSELTIIRAAQLGQQTRRWLSRTEVEHVAKKRRGETETTVP